MAVRRGAFALVALCAVLALAVEGAAAKRPLVPAMFVFGDSLVDVGNNNRLDRCNVSCKANHRPYGVDYPCHSPTGRFSNGYNLADQLAQQLGFAASPPPFLYLSNASAIRRMSTGINFASGGSGLLPTTGNEVCVEVVPMSEQVGNFTSLVRRRSAGSGGRTAPDVISKSLVFISVGSNDLFEYADHYITEANISSPSRNDTAFLQELIASYTSYVKDLHAAGARKFSVLSPSLVGCCPFQRKVAKDYGDVDQLGCLGTANNLSRQLHPMIASMLQGLSQELPGMSYSLGDAIGMAGWVFTNTNFTADRACCGAGDFGASLCNSSVPLCPDRSGYFFWDRYHPTEAASAITAKALFGGAAGPGRFVSPVNVQQLVAPRP
ncbi:hypothetical protein GQ55_7G244900 [Panicum hallii var. hallii]|uniref:GDSL esterase/lipase n=1 Tax=Panicum hallii var. hallii TaxID=1504633 RepID=A0A2T7CYP1_9POAL|nr:hypothetical protein GQ55_7G244900 [Panicum hallii var. hallii]